MLNIKTIFMEERQRLKLEAPWPEVKEMLKEVNTDLTDEDLNGDPNDQALLERLGRKMGRSPEEVRTWIESVSHNKGKAS
jgi:hypothetical protein